MCLWHSVYNLWSDSNMEGVRIQYEPSAFLEHRYCICKFVELQKQCFKQSSPETDSLREIVQGKIILDLTVK